MKLRIVLSLLLICLMLAPSAVSAATSQPINPPCTPFSGAFAFTKFEFTGATTASGKGKVFSNGQEIGTFSADYSSIDQKGKGVTQLDGAHTLTLAEGTLTTSDEIHLQADPKGSTVLRANSRLYIVDGKGKYAGATGLLHTHGAFDFVSLEGSIAFDGQLCVP
ncbi:MAG: hypothetical protein U0350_06765 [Caldilineaceae bacterium]